MWVGFPSHGDLWLEDLEPARREVIAFAHAIHAQGAGEQVRLVAADPKSAEVAREVAGLDIAVVEQGFGDIWLRDTGPIILAGHSGRAAACFQFNGWGGKYQLEGDDDIGVRLAGTADLPTSRFDWILEGGAVDVDGTGLLVTTEQCLLNPNRNSGLTKEDAEARLRDNLGVDRILWLGEGLLNDHTDGHVDNLARFVGENRLAIPVADGPDDPNAAVFADAHARAAAFGVEVVPIPSPGRVMRDDIIVPASYMNFYIGNAAIVVPIYGAPTDDAAVQAIGALFPGRKTVGINADHILTGGGSFHCISQQVPA